MKTIYIAAIDTEDDLMAAYADTEEGIIQAVLEACGEDHDAYLAWLADGGHDETAKFASDSVTDFMKSRGDEMFGWSYNAVELPAAPEGEAVLATPTAKAIQNAMGAINGLVDQIGQMSGMFDDEDGTIQQACDDAEEALAELKELASGAPVELSSGDCGQCEGTGTIEGGLGGDGEDEECPVCDGTGNLPEEEGSLYDLGDHAVSQELAPEAGYVLIDGFDGENESALMMQVLDTIPNKTLQDVMCANSHEISGVIRLGPVDDLQEIWATTHTDPSGGNAEFCLVYRKEG